MWICPKLLDWKLHPVNRSRMKLNEIFPPDSIGSNSLNVNIQGYQKRCEETELRRVSTKFVAVWLYVGQSCNILSKTEQRVFHDESQVVLVC